VSDLAEIERRIRAARLAQHEAQLLPAGALRASIERRAKLALLECRSELDSERAFGEFVDEQRRRNDGDTPTHVRRLMAQRNGLRTAAAARY
jgi:hypothetical protein